MEVGSVFFFRHSNFTCMGNLGDKREHGGAYLCTRENTRERSLHGSIDMKVALPLRFAFFFFLQGAEETNTFYLITPRSQELCERIGLPMKAGLHCWWVDVAEW